MKRKEWFYPVVKFFIRRALAIYCRQIRISSPEWLKQKGPLLLAANHPDSFLDAIIIGSRFSEPVYFLARGDAFRRPMVRKILTALKLIPIYRLSEGREHLALNDATFDRCNQIFQESGIILIFSEGLCVNQWELRPLKKGTARIALTAMESSDTARSLQILPVAISYDSFRRFGKKVLIDLGQSFGAGDVQGGDRESVTIHRFNHLLSGRLLAGIGRNRNDMEKKPGKGWSIANLVLLLPFALAGYLVHAPLFLPLRALAREKTASTVFYDSVLFGLLLLSYPLYYLLLLLCAALLKWPMLIYFFIALPVWARAYTVWKNSRLNVFYSAQAG